MLTKKKARKRCACCHNPTYHFDYVMNKYHDDLAICLACIEALGYEQVIQIINDPATMDRLGDRYPFGEYLNDCSSEHEGVEGTAFPVGLDFNSTTFKTKENNKNTDDEKDRMQLSEKRISHLNESLTKLQKEFYDSPSSSIRQEDLEQLQKNIIKQTLEKEHRIRDEVRRVTRRAHKEVKEAEDEKIEEKSLEQKRKEVLQPILNMIGMTHVKKEIQSWMEQAEAREALKKRTNLTFPSTSKHLVLTGNPGVGKTELARKLVKAMAFANLIEEDKLIEVKAEDLVGKYMGHTAQQTKEKIEEAKGGVLFLDEAYRLIGHSYKSEKANFGMEALETIMGYMESPDILFIFAGYEDLMQEFVDANDGLRSRIHSFFRIPDYTQEELTQIGITMFTKNGYDASLINESLTRHIHAEMSQGILKGNGRTVHQFITRIAEKHMVRVANDETIENPTQLLVEDVEKAFERSSGSQEGLTSLFKEAKEQLHELIGMKKLKQEVEKIANFQYIQRKRKKAGFPAQEQSYHMSLTGNPGTGKTTAARLVGKLFRGTGVLANGHFVEASKDTLTSGESIPQTVKRLVNKALGGILFIDEAYTLANDMKGREALDALIPLLENHKGEFICILAGYHTEMERLFKVNEGLRSRIVYHFEFEDYTESELLDIALLRIQQEGYELVNAQDVMYPIIHHAKKENHLDGNARWIRNWFENAIRCHSNRLVIEELAGKEIDSDSLKTLIQEDMIEGYKQFVPSANIIFQLEDQKLVQTNAS